MNILPQEKRERSARPGLLGRLLAGGSLFPTLLTLTLKGRTLRFRRPADFDFCIASRIAVPAARFEELLQRPVVERESEAATLRGLEHQLQGIVSDYQRLGISCTRMLARTGVRMISKDHDWRALFEQLAGGTQRHDAYTCIALLRYLAYLRARRAVIGMLPDLGRAPSAPAARPGADATVFAPDKATVSFTVGGGADIDHAQALRRLPQGRAVTVRLEDGGEIAIRLARHTFSLSHRQGWSLSSDDGKRYMLRDGVNSVGRSRSSDIPVDAGLRNVSRTHLLAEPLGADVIALTDVSTGGTWIPPDSIAS